MAEIIEMPKLSDTMTEGTLVRWRRKEGESIESGDVLAEVETDKATMDLEVFDSGVILKLLVHEGTSVPVGAPIAFIGEPGESVDISLPACAEESTAAATMSDVPSPAPQSAIQRIQASSSPSFRHSDAGQLREKTRIRISPLARKITDEHGLDPANLSGSGPGGRILKRDVMKALAGRSDSALDLPEGEPIAKDQRIPLSNMRKTIAKRLLQSKTETPHFYIEMDVDPAPLMELRETLNTRLAEQGQPIKLSLNDFILKATTEALCAVPEVNVSFEGDAIRQHASVHIAFAVTTPGGLLTPVVRNAHKKNLLLIGAEARQLADKAKQGKLTPEEYTGGTFTVSNLGMMGVDRFSAIINPPQAAILAVGATRATPVIDREGRVVPGKRMSLTLSVDHRALDGAQAARYLTELKKSIETPALLLL